MYILGTIIVNRFLNFILAFFSKGCIYAVMSNQRSAGQVLVNLWLNEEFLDEISRGMRVARCSERAKFIREAVYEKLERLGMSIPAEIMMAPPRGRRPRVTTGSQLGQLGYPMPGSVPGDQMNDGPVPKDLPEPKPVNYKSRRKKK
jgi:hypothetical protein